MANTILTSDIIAKEALAVLENNLVAAKNVNRQYDKEWSNTDRSIGDTINIKKPARYTVREGKTVSIQDHTEEKVPLVLDKQHGVDVEFDSKELTLDLDSFSDQVLKPQMAALSNRIDLEVLLKYKDVANAVGTPGTISSDFETYLDAGVRLDDNAAPQDGQRGIILNPRTQAKVVNSLKGLFQSSEEIKSQYEKGKMGTAAGFDWAMSQNVPVHTVGPLGGTPLVNGASQAGSTLITDGWTAAASLRLNKGDVFTIAGVFGVNPQSRMTTGALQQFVVTANVSSDGTGAASIPIWPALVATGAGQTVTALPADNAAITVLGAAGTQTPVNLAYHKDAFTLACANLVLPKGMDMAGRAMSKKTGLSVRFVRGYDITEDKFISRIDVLYGIATIRGEHACRIHS